MPGLGKNNENLDYIMQEAVSERITSEKNLWVVIDMGGYADSTMKGSYR